MTTGSDRKITYWDCFDGQAIRMLDGSDSGEINALAITKAGEHFVSGGEDKKIKLWDYDEGISYYAGIGHSGNITRVISIIVNIIVDCNLTRSEDHSECGHRGCNFLLAYTREGRGVLCRQGHANSCMITSFIFKTLNTHYNLNNDVLNFHAILTQLRSAFASQVLVQFLRCGSGIFEEV